MTTVAPQREYTIREAAKAIGMPAKQGERLLRRMIETGRVPFAAKRGPIWLVTQQSIEFVAAFPRLTGNSGQRASEEMRRQAAAMDPACKKLQKEWKKGHPTGWATRKRDRTTKPLKKTDAPLALRKAWKETAKTRHTLPWHPKYAETERTDLFRHAAAFCAKVAAEQGNPFILQRVDLARIASIRTDEASAVLEALVEVGVLEADSFRWRYIPKRGP
jgi:hypothetical protein